MASQDTDVLVVGAGPTGLATAAALRQRGLAPIVIDASETAQHTSRAAVVHARTLEVLEELSVSQTLVERGLIVADFRVRDRDRVLMDVSFRDLATPYPFTLMCPQSETEAVLRARLEALGGEVRQGSRAVGLELQSDGRALVRVARHGSDSDLRARFVVAADGGHSLIREAAGIAFEGGEYAQSFALADVRMDWPLGREEVTLFFSDAGLVVVAPLPGNRFRVVATVDEAPETPDADFMQRVLDARGPEVARGRIIDVAWSSRFRVHHRVAADFVSGPVLLAGDAAHVHSPAGGQGMNTGIQDGLAAAAAIGRSLAEGDHHGLDEYGQHRRSIAKSVVAMTDRMTRIATVRNSASRHIRNAVMPMIGSLPPVRQRLARTLAELDNS